VCKLRTPFELALPSEGKTYLNIFSMKATCSKKGSAAAWPAASILLIGLRLPGLQAGMRELRGQADDR
jgi:hypothetical protein